MSYTMQDFKRDYMKEHLPQLPPEELQDVLASLPVEALQSLPPEKLQYVLASLPTELLQSLPPEKRMAGLSEDQIRRYLEQLTAARSPKGRKSRRKK